MDPVFSKYWPLPSGFDLAKGRLPEVAFAVETEVQRFIQKEKLSKEEIRISTLSDVFERPSLLDNAPIHYFVFATRSDWIAIWTSTFLCTGYDSLSYCLTKNHGFETVHFSGTDTGGIFQPGNVFTYRSRSNERSIAAIQEDARWTFHTSGRPLPHEDIDRYRRRRIRDRWNQNALLELLGKLGIYPWSEDFYDFSTPVVHLERTSPPGTISRVTLEECMARHKRGLANQSA